MTIRQFQMLNIFRQQDFSIENALDLNQLTFGSLCFQKWVIYSPKLNRFILSPEGRTAHDFALHFNHYRQHNNHRFSVRVKLRRGVLRQMTPRRVQQIHEAA